MRFTTMWYVWPAKAQTSLRIHAVWSKPLLVAWIFYDCWATKWTSFGFSKLNRRLHRLVWVYTCKCRSRGGTWKIASYMGFYREWAIGPPWKKLEQQNLNKNSRDVNIAPALGKTITKLLCQWSVKCRGKKVHASRVFKDIYYVRFHNPSYHNRETQFSILLN